MLPLPLRSPSSCSLGFSTHSTLLVPDCCAELVHFPTLSSRGLREYQPNHQSPFWPSSQDSETPDIAINRLGNTHQISDRPLRHSSTSTHPPSLTRVSSSVTHLIKPSTLGYCLSTSSFLSIVSWCPEPRRDTRIQNNILTSNTSYGRACLSLRNSIPPSGRTNLTFSDQRQAIDMPHFDPSPAASQMDAAEMVNVNRILQLCTVPDVGPSPLDPHLSAEKRYTNALTQIEKVSTVFDLHLYHDFVFAKQVDEELLEQELLYIAKELGVPEQHLPANYMRSLPSLPPGPVMLDLSFVLDKKELPPTPEESEDSLTTLRSESSTSFRTSSTDFNANPSRPSLSLTFRKFSGRQTSLSVDGRPETANSLFSTFSRGPASPRSPRRTKTRESFMNLFRGSPKSPSQLVPSRLDESGNWVPIPTDGEVPALESSKSDQASTTSPTSISSRTSASSFTDLTSFSWLDSRTLQRCTKVSSFITLRSKCQEEAKRFIDFSQHQRVALPLFVGRSRMYLESRIEIRIADLKKKHIAATEAMENKHLAQEITKMEEHTAQSAETKTKNVTALKHMNRRLSLLGESATETDHLRLAEEERALERSAARQERELRNLYRDQTREGHDSKRNQQKDLEDFERSLREDYDQQVKDKQAVLLDNQKKLEELIHARTLRLVSRWWLLLQIWKKTDGEKIMMSCGNVVNGPLPLGLLGLPEDFGPYITAFH
ncbi:hypothetical protein BT63DRAFT_420130 [Microthyrium microscopicum]|uniref:Uncharacterized protein n=1 Tax=Microthyrium microscopicum TaxID=703497 RepID=A0A6A6UTR4_9PEZI|nr:hypothetical protein BT63DRAFT_420130 [Microthyrium microscopicum]